MKAIKRKKEKVFVGLSGGVDSSVSAFLLKRAGFDVTGVFIKGWYPDFLPCEWREDRRDAMRVCAKLNIPFLTLDAEKEYKREVIDYMINEYKKGRTPNPDIMCNKEIKFGVFLKFAEKNGADFIATGHYARIDPEFSISNSQSSRNRRGGDYVLKVARDLKKDQSYFLWALNQRQLAKIIFPLGDLKKTEVRNIARRSGLNTAEKKDSQGICFLGKVDIKDFLKHYIPEKSGDVLNTKGQKIGTHKGIHFLTIGQRHGFEVRNKDAKSKKMYIVSKNIRKNTITVASVEKEADAGGAQKITLEKVNWIGEKPKDDKIYLARTRYREKPLKARVGLKNKIWEVNLEEKTNFISSGQSLVLYGKDGECLGGGLISSVDW